MRTYPRSSSKKGEEGTVVIISGTSAWEYYRTPPVVRDAAIPKDAVLHTDSPKAIRSMRKHVRANASEATRRILPRLCTDLKGLRLPVHVIASDSNAYHHTRYVAYHHARRPFAKEDLVPLGAGVFVTSPELTLAQLASRCSRTSLLLKMYEACGTYATFAPTPQASFVLTQLVENGFLKAAQAAPGVGAFYDARGKRAPALAPSGEPFAWKPCVDRFGALTDLWRRPPLTNSEKLRAFMSATRYLHGIAQARRAANEVHDGSASPLETRFALMACLNARNGGEGWPAPTFNQRIDLNVSARRLAGTDYCVADLLWPAERVDVELNGKAFHADRLGFSRSSGRRAALESMGYTVIEITYEQMAKPDMLEPMLELCAGKIDQPLQARTRDFLRAREQLHAELFVNRGGK